MRTHHIAGLSIALVAALLVGASGAYAAFTTPTCLAKKRGAQGNLQKCRATEDAKALQGKPANLGKCTTKFQEKIAALNEKASEKAIVCRYRDNGDGTVSDYDTGLEWEKKDGAGGGANLANPHDVDNFYDWSSDSATTATSGMAFTDFLNRLNHCSFGGLLNFAGFAFHCDWRLPTLQELETIVDATQGFCGGGSGACIDPIFGPTAATFTWSSTTDTAASFEAWGVFFGDGSVVDDSKVDGNQVRAVRGGL